MEPQLSWDNVGFMQMCELSENRMAMKTSFDSDAFKTQTLNVNCLFNDSSVSKTSEFPV